MYGIPFAIGSLLFSLTVSITANDIFPYNRVVEGLSVFAVLMNVANLVVNIYIKDHNGDGRKKLTLSKLPRRQKYSILLAMFLFMSSEIICVFLMTSWMLWSVYATGFYLKLLAGCMAVMMVTVFAGLNLKHIENGKWRETFGIIVSIIGVLSLVSVVIVICRG